MDAADDNPGLAGLEEAVEPTLVLEFPPPAFAAMRLDPTAACITDTAAKAQASIPIQSSMQSFAHSPGSDCHQAQDCNQIVCSVSGETTEAQPKQAALLPCLQLSTAVSRHEADAAVHQQSGTESGGTARLSDGQPEVAAVSAVHATPGTVQQARQQYPYSVKEAVAQRQTLQQQADLSRQPRPVGPQAATPEIEADTVSQRPDSMEGNVVRGKQPSSSETFGLADGQENSPGGHATAADGQAAKHDGQSLSADGQDATTNWPILALAGAEPAVLDETVSEACCVCKCAEDGEIMLLCDKCDQPAHLGCVGLDTVPEGDWFCPSCTSAMVCILPISGAPCAAVAQHYARMCVCLTGTELVLHCKHSSSEATAWCPMPSTRHIYSATYVCCTSAVCQVYPACTPYQDSLEAAITFRTWLCMRCTKAEAVHLMLFPFLIPSFRISAMLQTFVVLPF